MNSDSFGTSLLRPFFELRQRIRNCVPLCLGAYELMIPWNDPAMIVDRPQVDVYEVRKIRVRGEKRRSARAAESLYQLIRYIVTRKEIGSLGNPHGRRLKLDICSKGGAAQPAANRAIAETCIGRPAFELEPDAFALTMSCSRFQDRPESMSFIAWDSAKLARHEMKMLARSKSQL